MHHLNWLVTEKNIHIPNRYAVYSGTSLFQPHSGPAKVAGSQGYLTNPAIL